MFQVWMVLVETAPEDSDAGQNSHICHNRPRAQKGNLGKKLQ